MSADVLVLYPPLHRLYGERKQWMPLSILCLTTYLNEHGVDALAYNADCDLIEPEKILSYTERFESGRFFQQRLVGEDPIWDEIRDVLHEVHPKIVGISILTEALGSVKRTVKIIKEILPTAILIGGGPHAEIDADYLINELHFDYILKGDGEETLRQLCSDLLKGKKVEEKIIESVRIPMCQLSIPKLESHYHFSEYKKAGKKFNITTSRGGCPFSCSFCYCSKYKYSLRYLNPEGVVDEVQHHIEHYNTRKIFFVDDTFTLNKEYVKNVCNEIIRRELSFSWTCTTRAGQVDRGTLSLMKAAGCSSIHLGIESGSERVLKLLNKKIDFNMVEESSSLIKGAGIESRMFFMAGLPTETPADLQKTIDCIRRFEPDETILDVYVPIPGTKLFDYIINIGYRIDKLDWCAFSRDAVPYHEYINDVDGTYDKKLEELFMVVEEMNARKE